MARRAASIWNADASEVYDLAEDLSKVGARLVPSLRSAFDHLGGVLADRWSANAVETSGDHGKHYPKSITSRPILGVSRVGAEAYADPAKRQGSMARGFEFGSRNQPPHLDGLRALRSMEGDVESVVASVIDGTFAAAASGKGLQEYVTKAGNTRLATAAQIANWTRGSR